MKNKNQALAEINRIRELAGLPIIEAEQVDRVAIGHEDDERQMQIKQIHQMNHQLESLAQMLEDLPEDSDFPHWWQGKLIRAADYITTTYQYLENEMAEYQGKLPPHDDSEFDTDIQDPSGVS